MTYKRPFLLHVSSKPLLANPKLTIIIGANKQTPALTRRNALLQRKHARGQRPDAFRVEHARGGGGGTGKGYFDGEAVARDAGGCVEAGEGAGVGDGGGGGGDVAEGGLDEDAAGEEGDVAGCEVDGLDGVSELCLWKSLRDGIHTAWS